MSHLSKVYVEKLLEMYTRGGFLSGISVRLGIVYGLGPVMKSDPRFLTVPNLFARQAARGVTLRVNPQATASLGFIHLDDAVKALLAAEKLDASYASANAVAEPLTVTEVALAVQRAGRERGLEVIIEPRPDASKEHDRFTISSRLASTGWKPTNALDDRIGEVIDHALSGRWSDC
jgi:nucleoside-diphosphate-sugar epimerase